MLWMWLAKAKRGAAAVVTNFRLREDGSYRLREDGSIRLRE